MEYTERTQDLINLKNTLKEADYLKAIEEKLDTLKNDEESIKGEIHNNLKALDIMKEIEPETDKIEGLINSIDKEIALIEEQLVIKMNIMSRIDEEIQRNPSASDDLGHMALLKEKETMEKRLGTLDTNQQSLRFILDLLDEIISAREKKNYGGLTTKTLNKFNYLTNNQYVTKIDESVIQRLISGETINDLGPSVIYELQATLKFAITDFIADSRISLPLIIDEPFQFMDDEREGRFRELLLEVSEKRQIILFTHHSDKKDWGRYIQL